MLTLEQQIAQLADAVDREIQPNDADSGRVLTRSRPWMLGAAAGVLVLAGVAAVAAVVTRSADSPSDDLDVATTPFPVGTTSSTTSTPPTTMATDDAVVERLVSPVDAAIAERLGVSIDQVLEASRRSELRSVRDCIIADGWIVTDADLEVIRTDTITDSSPNVGETAGENALNNDQLRRQYDIAFLRQDPTFSTTVRGCVGTARITDSELRNLRTRLALRPTFGVGSDPRYLDAQDVYERCLADLGFRPETLDDAYGEISQEVFDAVARLDSDAQADALDQLGELDADERQLDTRVSPCTEPIGAMERNLVFEREAEFLDDNPDFVDDVAGDIGDARDLVADPESPRQLTVGAATSPMLSITVPAPLADWRFERIGAPPIPEIDDVEPTYGLWAIGDDPMATPRMLLTISETASVEGFELDGRPQRSSETERRLVRETRNAVSIVGGESTLPGPDGRSVQSFIGVVSLPNGFVIEVDMRGIGLNTTLEILGSLGTEPAPEAGAEIERLAIGDLVMAGAAIHLTESGFVVDAVESRQFGDGLDTLRSLSDQGRLGEVVVIDLANNGPIDEISITGLMDTLGDVDHIVLITTNVTNGYAEDNNQVLADTAVGFDNVTLLDWATLSDECDGDCFEFDQLHLGPDGRRFYADAIENAINP